MYFYSLKMIYFLLMFIITGAWCKSTEQIIVTIGQSFSFDCQLDENIYFARRSGDWTEIQENNDQFNLNFDRLSDKNILRVTSDSAQTENIGYYGCRKSTKSKTTMNRIYHLILADVQSFYWTYVCYGPVGSCIRTDDVVDENLSTFEVADQTNLDLFCCASVTGYKNIDINMNQVGELRGKIDVKRKQELDGSWVVCANQHTFLKQTSMGNRQTLTCELITDNKSYSKLTSIIAMKDAIAVDPDDDEHYDYKPVSKDNNGGYFNPGKPSSGGRRRGSSTGVSFSLIKEIAIILGFIFGALCVCGCLGCLIFFLIHKKKAAANYKTDRANRYLAAHTGDNSKKANELNPKEEESIYIEPTPLYVNTPVFLRL